MYQFDVEFLAPAVYIQIERLGDNFVSIDRRELFDVKRLVDLRNRAERINYRCGATLKLLAVDQLKEQGRDGKYYDRKFGFMPSTRQIAISRHCNNPEHAVYSSYFLAAWGGLLDAERDLILKTSETEKWDEIYGYETPESGPDKFAGHLSAATDRYIQWLTEPSPGFELQSGSTGASGPGNDLGRNSGARDRSAGGDGAAAVGGTGQAPELDFRIAAIFNGIATGAIQQVEPKRDTQGRLINRVDTKLVQRAAPLMRQELRKRLSPYEFSSVIARAQYEMFIQRKIGWLLRKLNSLNLRQTEFWIPGASLPMK